MAKKNLKACYFNHDYDACTDDKILQLRIKKGWEGYGLYWALVEAMAKSSSGYLSSEIIGALELRLATPKEVLLDVIDSCLDVGLFDEHPEHGVFSHRMFEHKEYRQLCSNSGSKGGKASAESKRKARGGTISVQAIKKERDKEINKEINKEPTFLSEDNSDEIPGPELTELEKGALKIYEMRESCTVDDVIIHLKNRFQGEMDKVDLIAIAEACHESWQANGFPKRDWHAGATKYYKTCRKIPQYRKDGADLRTGNSNVPVTKAIEITFCDKCWGTTENKKRGEDFCSCNLNNHPNIPAFRKNHHHIIFLKPDETFDEWKFENFNEAKQTELEYFFCNVCGRYSVNYGEDFCSCLQNLNKKEKPDFIQKHHKIVSVPKTENFEEWGKKHIEKKGEVFVIN